jgi:hypothetical protein
MVTDTKQDIALEYLQLCRSRHDQQGYYIGLAQQYGLDDHTISAALGVPEERVGQILAGDIA